MTASDDWYRSTEWDEKARAAFDAKIRRARKGYNRAQYFWLKAGALFHSGDLERRRAAVALLERALVESGAEDRHLAHLLDDLSGYQLALGDTTGARATLERCLALGPRGYSQSVSPEETLARILIDEGGDRERARAMFDVHYTNYPGLKPPAYETLAAREVLDVMGQPYTDPDAAAEAIVVYYHAGEGREPPVPEVFASDRSSLVALDRHFRLMPRNADRPFTPRRAFKRELLEERFVAELGAYAGRVLVNERGGRWRAARPLMQSRVVVGQCEVDPFRVGYDAVYYEHPLVDVLTVE
jgi:hypothetical protein